MDSISQWIAALNSPDSAQRTDAAESLSRLGAEAQPAAVALVRACADDAEEVREAVAAALEELGAPVVGDVPALVSLLAAKEADVGYWAATLLGRLGSEAADAVAPLATVLTTSRNLNVRQRAAWALGEMGPAASAALEALTNAAKSDDPRLARLAQQAIGQIRG